MVIFNCYYLALKYVFGVHVTVEPRYQRDMLKCLYYPGVRIKRFTNTKTKADIFHGNKTFCSCM